MHVLILNQTFYPDVAATAQLMWDLALHLRAAGHRVTAVTSRVAYGTDRQHPLARQHIEGVEVVRVAGTRFGKRHLAGRMSDFLSYYASAYAELQRLPRPDVILALTSPPLVALLGVLQRQFHGTPLVYHVMDLYPDAAESMGLIRQGSVTQRLTARLTRRTLECSDGIIALGRDMAERLVRRYRLPPAVARRIEVIPPWSDGAALRPIDRADNPMAAQLGIAPGDFAIVYSGNLGMAHDVETLVGAIERLRGESAMRWLFIGGGNRFDELKARAAAAGWPDVRFLPYQDRSALIHSLNLADVHLVSQLPAFTGIVVPSKLYGIMAVGRPSVMVGPDDVECSRVIRETGGGIVVANGDVDGLVAALRRLRDDPVLRAEMGRRAREAFMAAYDRPIACARIETLLALAAGRLNGSSKPVHHRQAQPSVGCAH